MSCLRRYINISTGMNSKPGIHRPLGSVPWPRASIQDAVDTLGFSPSTSKDKEEGVPSTKIPKSNVNEHIKIGDKLVGNVSISRTEKARREKEATEPIQR